MNDYNDSVVKSLISNSVLRAVHNLLDSRRPVRKGVIFLLNNSVSSSHLESLAGGLLATWSLTGPLLITLKTEIAWR